MKDAEAATDSADSEADDPTEGQVRVRAGSACLQVNSSSARVAGVQVGSFCDGAHAQAWAAAMYFRVGR